MTRVGFMNTTGNVRRHYLLPEELPAGALATWALYFILFLFLPHSALKAQSKDDTLLNQVTPESQFLDLIDLVEEPRKQLELFDTFVTQFPKYEGLGTVHAQMQDLCVQLKLWDRALAIGDKLIKIDESDLATVRLNLQAAEGKNDAGLIAKWRERIKQLEAPQGEVTASSAVRLPFVDDEPAGDLSTLDLSSVPKSQKPRIEAILFNKAVEERDPKRRLELLTLFAKQFPSSVHIGKVSYLFFLTHRERQDHVKALAAAEAFLERDKTREDVLFYVAQTYFLTKREPAKVLSYSELVLAIVNNRERPENLSESEWSKQKQMLIQQSNWMAGSTRIGQEHWADADKSLRAALQSTAQGSDLAAALLSNLGWANYKLRNIPEALKMYQQCSAIRGPFQAQATQSIQSIKSEYNLQ
jgi:tetratricopeptide (TPR) repeat protein